AAGFAAEARTNGGTLQSGWSAAVPADAERCNSGQLRLEPRAQAPACGPGPTGSSGLRPPAPRPHEGAAPPLVLALVGPELVAVPFAIGARPGPVRRAVSRDPAAQVRAPALLAHIVQ